MQVSDTDTLHLARHFFTDIAPTSRRLFILGDFVEYWIGDDADDGSLDSVFDSIASLQGKGTEVILMHGNRDFLIGQQFARRLNAQLITDDHYLLSLNDTRVLLMHGDTLCTADTNYQTMRAKSRSDSWQQQFLSQSIEERREYALKLRRESHTRGASLEPTLMEVVEETVVEQLQHHHATTLIHGHTHKPDCHNHIVDDTAAKRWVVGDWHPDHAIYAMMEDNNISLKRYSHLANF